MEAAPAVRGSTYRDYVSLLRPKDWLKNLFVLAPLLYSGRFREPEAAAEAALASAWFCLLSSATYVWNDINDREEDARHPHKRHSRAIAAGRVPVRAAWVYLGLLVLLAAGLMRLTPAAVPAALAYVGLQVSYGLMLRRFVGLDLLAIAAGFVCRVEAGSAAVAVKTSAWMLAATFCLALYLAASKRLAEWRGSRALGRASLQQYTEAGLIRITLACGAAATLIYACYAIFVHPALLHTLVFVPPSIFRYWRTMRAHPARETPSEIIWGDKILMGILVLYALDCAVTLYLFPPPPLL